MASISHNECGAYTLTFSTNMQIPMYLAHSKPQAIFQRVFLCKRVHTWYGFGLHVDMKVLSLNVGEINMEFISSRKRFMEIMSHKSSSDSQIW